VEAIDLHQVHSLAFVALIFFGAPLSGQAQELVEVCESLANSGLVDTRDYAAITSQYSSQFRHVCEFESEMVSRLKSSNGSFKGTFKAFGLSGGGGKSASETTESIKASCDLGQDSFMNYVQVNERESLGSILASTIVQCVDTLAQAKIEAIMGTVSVDAADTGFDVVVRYSAGDTPLTYTLTRIPDGTECFTDSVAGEVAQGNVTLSPNSESSFYCTKNEGLPASGTLVFEARVDNSTKSKVVSFLAPSRNLEFETAAKIEARVAAISDELNQKIDSLASKVDSGAASFSAQLSGLQGRKLACTTYQRGRGAGGVAGWSKEAYCADTREVVVSCIFGSNISSYNRVSNNGVQGCRAQPSADWAAATCCMIAD
jgi:hypothetical protein